MKDRLNKRVKYRQAFRPFAPIVLAEREQEFSLARAICHLCCMASRFAPNGGAKSRQSFTSTARRACKRVRQEQNPRLYRVT